jgi:3-oxoacyl-[acyl-carrier-protein] synthase-3
VALFEINNISIKGIAACVPKKILSNQDFAYHSELENKQFIKTTGIEYRRVVEENTTASDLCLKSAVEIIQALKWDKSEVSILVFISQTPDYKIPCTATILQDKLGLSKSCIAFDVNLGCSGYVYGLSIVGALLEKIKGKALLLVGDASSTCVSQRDKSTAPLFSDAGSATAMSFEENDLPIYFNLQSDGAGFDAIITKDGGARNPISERSFLLNGETGRRDIDMYLDGIKVFNFSRREVVPNMELLLSNFNLNRETFDAFVFHQANKFMNDTIAKKLNLDQDKVPQSLRFYGNTGAASIPVTIVDQLLNSAHSKLVLSGFGVGLSWGSCALSLGDTLLLPIIEY